MFYYVLVPEELRHLQHCAAIVSLQKSNSSKTKRYITFVGAAQTFGRFAETPFPEIVSPWLRVNHLVFPSIVTHYGARVQRMGGVIQFALPNRRRIQKLPRPTMVNLGRRL